MKAYVTLALLLALAACHKPAQTPDPGPAVTAAPVTDTWPGKYEGNVMVTVAGAPGSHKIMLVTATADCNGDLGIVEGGLPASDISPTEMRLTVGQDTASICKVDLKQAGDTVTVTEDNCAAYHGGTCSFNGKATRVR